ncbi:MAG: hypothetical protein RL339_553 [Pseudomonadota bacterium]|jgi:hydrogenase/urease accessory protein HupE
MIAALRALLVLLALTLGGTSLQAHEVRPALVQIEELGPGDYDVVWKRPVVGDLALRLEPRLSSGALQQKPTIQTGPGFATYRWKVRSGAPLAGQTLEIEGLAQSVTETLVRVKLSDGRSFDWTLQPSSPRLVLDFSEPAGVALPGYLVLGLEHILRGFDHLLFVLALLMLVGWGWQIVKVITAFTIAHSLTLALSVLGYVRLDTAALEVLIALSIVFLAVELVTVRGDRPTLTRRYPWIVAFTFGLLHGFGFASALANIGLPADAVPEALLLFNIGVELGQLVFILLVLGLGLLAVRLLPRRRWGELLLQRGPAVLANAIGGLAGFWLIERTYSALA